MPAQKEALKELIENGKAHGVLDFAGEEPVGWCSFGPRPDFPSLERVKAYKRSETSDVWSIICFFVDPKWRGKGLSRGLLGAAIDVMRKHGVEIAEAYPVTTAESGKRLSSSLAWAGPLKIFEEIEFKTVQSINPLRPLMKLELK